MQTSRSSIARQVVAFGFLATFMSSFGQTFFLGLFNPQFQDAAGIGSTRVGLLYGIATFASGMLLFWLGGAMDRIPLRRGVVITLALFVTGGFLAAGVQGCLLLLLAFFLLRLGGQGLLTHLAVVAAVRNGGPRKGTIIAWSSMGVILGEAILPAGVVAALGFLHWRELWLIVAATVALLVTPGLLYLQRDLLWREVPATEAPPATPLGRGALLKAPAFWAAAAVLLAPPFMATGFLFELTSIADLKGWRPGTIGAAFTVFAVLRAAGTWFYGRAVDRFGAIRMTYLHLVPMALAFASLALPLGGISIWLAFAGIGFSNGANAVLGGALWVELFGTAAVGTVRGVATAAMVISTAIAPVVVAAALAQGMGAGGLGLAFAGYALLAPLIVRPWLRPALDKRW